MKKIKFISMLFLALTATFIGCKTEEPNNVDDIVEDGFYVIGAATPIADLSVTGANKAIMAVGFNEVLQSSSTTDDEKFGSASQRAGMYEKYIYLEGGKSFSLVLKQGTVETAYGANLALSDTLTGENEPAIRVYKGVMTENSTMQVASTGLYHIVLDLNLNSDLANKLILVAPVEWGVRGGMNSWGFTKMTQTITDSTINYVIEDQEMAAGAKFKFAYGGGWKIILDEAGLVKANTNLGTDMFPGGNDIAVETGGKYKITLTYRLAQGDIKDSYTYTVELTEASSLPTEMYMIGADFGNWSWSDAGVVTLTPVNGVAGAFWCVNYFTANNGFKWCAVKDWNGDFAGLTTNTGYTIASGNATVDADGLYMVYIDLANQKIAMEPAAVYGMGDAFGGWNAATYPFTISGSTMSITTTAAGNLRMYAGSSIATTDWWTREFNIFDGAIVYRGNGGDQAAVPVTAGQVVTLDFKNGTGTIQ